MPNTAANTTSCCRAVCQNSTHLPQARHKYLRWLGKARRETREERRGSSKYLHRAWRSKLA